MHPVTIDVIKRYVVDNIGSQLPVNLFYHGIHHTLEVYNVCNQYISRLNISEGDSLLLRTAALLHDVGFINTYENHEEEGAIIAKDILPTWHFSKQDQNRILSMILSTKIPQSPKALLEQILCDADLDYLGTENFYLIGETLYRELHAHNKIKDEAEWHKVQIAFLQKHHYHTEFAKKNREPIKQNHLNDLKTKLSE